MNNLNVFLNTYIDYEHLLDNSCHFGAHCFRVDKKNFLAYLKPEFVSQFAHHKSLTLEQLTEHHDKFVPHFNSAVKKAFLLQQKVLKSLQKHERANLPVLLVHILLSYPNSVLDDKLVDELDNVKKFPVYANVWRSFDEKSDAIALEEFHKLLKILDEPKLHWNAIGHSYNDLFKALNYLNTFEMVLNYDKILDEKFDVGAYHNKNLDTQTGIENTLLRRGKSVPLDEWEKRYFNPNPNSVLYHKIACAPWELESNSQGLAPFAPSKELTIVDNVDMESVWQEITRDRFLNNKSYDFEAETNTFGKWQMYFLAQWRNEKSLSYLQSRELASQQAANNLVYLKQLEPQVFEQNQNLYVWAMHRGINAKAIAKDFQRSKQIFANQGR